MQVYTERIYGDGTAVWSVLPTQCSTTYSTVFLFAELWTYKTGIYNKYFLFVYFKNPIFKILQFN